MRRIVMFNRVTADGYFGGPHGELDWTVPEPAIDKDAVASMSGRGTLLLGRRTYEMFASFWPSITAETASAPGPHGEHPSAEMRAMGIWLNSATKYVFSRTLSEAGWVNSQLRASFDADEMARLKAEPGGDILIFGSGSIVSLLTEHGLIDEYQFIVTPTLLGAGQSMVRDVSGKRPLTLLDATAYPSGNVRLRYQLTDSAAM